MEQLQMLSKMKEGRTVYKYVLMKKILGYGYSSLINGVKSFSQIKLTRRVLKE